MASLLEQLDRDWSSRTAQQAQLKMFTWAAAEPALAAQGRTLRQLIGPGAIRISSREINDVLAALLRLSADDPIARRTVLQAIVPGMAALVGRFRYLVGDVFDNVAELEHEVVGSAFERICLLSGRTVEWPASEILQATRERVRTLARASWRLRDRRQEGVDLDIRAADVQAEEELGSIVCAAAREGLIGIGAARAILATRVLGIATNEWAAREQRDVRAVRKARERAEDRLVEALRCPETRRWLTG